VSDILAPALWLCPPSGALTGRRGRHHARVSSAGCWNGSPWRKCITAKGRFRTFLLAAMNHLLADEWEQSQGQERGAHQVINMDFQM